MPGQGQNWRGESPSPRNQGVCLLCDLRNGESATITEIVGDHPQPPLLESYGFVPGVRVVRERTAPQGDPIIFRIEGRLVALRREDAMQISVRRKERE